MTTVVFDIETVSFPWLDLDPMLREKLVRNAEDQDDFQRRKKGGALSPYTGKAVVIAMMNPETRKGIVWYESARRADLAPVRRRPLRIRRLRRSVDAGGLLEEGGEVRPVRVVQRAEFDGPFLSVRSAVHGIPPSKISSDGVSNSPRPSI